MSCIPVGAALAVALGLGALLTLVSGQATVQCFSQFERSEFPYCKQLSPDYVLHWKVANRFITFGIAVAGKYKMVGLGISNSGGMRGADIMLLNKQESVTAGSIWQIGDYFSTDFEAPELDPEDHQDWSLDSVSQTAQLTTAVVSRALDTCDTNDIQIYNDTDQSIIYAYAVNFGYHGSNRGQVTLRLNPANYNTTLNITGSTMAPGSVNLGNTTEYTYRMAVMAEDPADLTPLPLTFSNFRVPAVQTTYQCINLALPDDGQKYHVIRYGGILSQGPSAGLVHHIVLWGCRSMPARLNTPIQCFSTPPECQTPIAIWAPGVSNFSLPPEAALPFGGPGSSDPSVPPPLRYVSLQVHYNNPAGLKNVLDSSGIMLYYTAALRPYDMGVLMLGSYGISVPPGVTNYSIPENPCPSNCTARLTQNLTLAYNFFHMHQAGQSIITKHIRNGTELEPLGSKGWFSFNYQGVSQVLPDSRTLMPGDTLSTICTYNTTGRTSYTKWGFSTQDEMCYNFLYYYPSVPSWVECIASPDNSLSASCGVGPGGVTTSAGLKQVIGSALNTTLNSTGMGTYDSAPVLSALMSSINLNNLTNSVLAALAPFNSPAPPPSNASKNSTSSMMGASNSTWGALGSVNMTAAAMAAVMAARSSIAGAINGTTALGSGVSGAVTQALLVNAINFTAVLNTLPVALVLPADWNYTAFIEPCLAAVPIPFRPPRTGPAAAAIICAILALGLLGTYLWFQFARKEDPERLALLAKLEETILKEAATNPDNLTEEQLRARLEEVAKTEFQKKDYSAQV